MQHSNIYPFQGKNEYWMRCSTNSSEKIRQTHIENLKYHISNFSHFSRIIISVIIGQILLIIGGSVSGKVPGGGGFSGNLQAWNINKAQKNQVNIMVVQYNFLGSTGSGFNFVLLLLLLYLLVINTIFFPDMWYPCHLLPLTQSAVAIMCPIIHLIICCHCFDPTYNILDGMLICWIILCSIWIPIR